MSTAAVEKEPGKQLQIMREIDEPAGTIAAFSSQSAFESAQRIAKALSSSNIVPENYRGEKNVANCLVAMELASRTGASVMMVMQNMYVIQGKPSWSSTFLIASVNASGRFSPIRYEIEGEEAKDGWRCRAYALDLASKERLNGEWITWEMVKAEGWLGKQGSKWKTMPGQMIRYRAAAFWTRTYAPEISLGMHTMEEVADVGERSVSPGTASLNQAIAEVEAEDIRPAGNSVNEADVPCPDCSAQPWKNHEDHCPRA